MFSSHKLFFFCVNLLQLVHMCSNSYKLAVHVESCTKQEIHDII